jgi:predicted dithiol-disulfide oxidoreductase (DUF899 family)
MNAKQPLLKSASEMAGASTIRFPNESDAYRRARTALLAEEIELRRSIERVAALRRALPPGGEVHEDYVFEGVEGPVHLSGLFGNKDTLVTYNFMFGPQRAKPCPMCTCLLGALDAGTPDILQRVAFAVFARSPIERLAAWAKDRGWRYLPLYSSGDNSFNADYGHEPPGEDLPAINVFTRHDGIVRHFYGDELGQTSDPGQDPRGAPELMPLWNVLDLTPAGRGQDWYPKLSY